MKKGLLFIIIAGAVDLALLIGLFIVSVNDYNEFPFLFLFVFPIVVSAVIFFILKHKKRSPLRILRWVLVTYFICFVVPAAIMLVLAGIFSPRARALYGVQPQPEYGVEYGLLPLIGFKGLKSLFRK